MKKHHNIKWTDPWAILLGHWDSCRRPGMITAAHSPLIFRDILHSPLSDGLCQDSNWSQHLARIINEVLLPVSCSKASLPRVFRAGLCPDWDQWDQTKPVDNAREAMQQADDWLGIPQVESVPFQWSRGNTFFLPQMTSWIYKQRTGDFCHCLTWSDHLWLLLLAMSMTHYTFWPCLLNLS